MQLPDVEPMQHLIPTSSSAIGLRQQHPLCYELDIQAMELKRVSAQGNESLIEYFEAFGQSSYPSFRALATKMVALIHYLEQTVDAPAQWVTTSHGWFYFGAVDYWDPLRARVFVYARPEGFEIRYRSTEQFIDWTQSFTSIQATTVIEAATAIEQALQEAIHNPLGRFSPDESTP